MNCLKCPNYWSNKIDETKCDQCGKDKELVDVVDEMPPLLAGEKTLVGGYHLKR